MNAHRFAANPPEIREFVAIRRAPDRCAYDGGWLAYLTLSRRVRDTYFNHEDAKNAKNFIGYTSIVRPFPIRTFVRFVPSW
jgi:hypothetical protein